MDVKSKLPLNQGQQDASDGFFSFLFAPETEMGITGPGGTGKTFLMGHMIDEIMPQYHATCKMMGIEPKFDSVEMTATTNQAAEVLALEAKRPTSTAASLFGLKVTEDWNTGDTKLIQGNNWQIHSRKVIFVDEASMVDSPMYNFINAGTIGCKIVYVGDHCQMAPVKETISPVYRGSINHFQLTQPMRTNIPELHSLNWQLRTTVETGVFKPIQIIPGIIDWYTDEQMEAAVTASFQNQTLTDRILAYTNARVVEFNDEIRAIRGLPSSFTVGEFLINNTAIPLKVSPSLVQMLSIGSEVEIISLDPTVKDWKVGNFDGEDLYIQYQDAVIRDRIGRVFSTCKLPSDRQHYKQVHDWLGKKKAWKLFFDMSKQFLDLRQRDASTIYKAQGSSLDTVYIDAKNLSRSTNPAQAARMLYVAASRARKHIVFYGELHSRYGGLTI